MDQVEGAGASSRLFLNLRENKGYTYGVYSAFTALKYPGPWQAGGQMRTEVTGDSMTEFMNELRRIREEKVPAAELLEKKQSIVANFALSLEQPTTQLNFAITRKIYGFPADYWDTYPAKIMAITADDVQRVARKYIPIDALQVVAVGDAAKIKPMLEKFGAVEVWDSEGRPKMASK
jgi:predicted Zn-dependent peptidase